MSKSENKLVRAKGWFMLYCETMNKLARSYGKEMSPQAWAELRNCKYVKLCEKIHQNKDYKCSQDEINLIKKFYCELVSYYKELNDNNISKEEFFKQYCVDSLTKIIEQHPVVSDKTIIKGKEKEVMEETKPTISIADKLSALDKLDFEHPSSIDFNQLYEDDLIFFKEDNRPYILSNDLYSDDILMISEEEKKKAFELEIKLMKAFFEHCYLKGYLKPLLKMFNERDNLLTQFKNEQDTAKKQVLMFEIKELDKKISQFKKNKMKGGN